MTDESVYKIKEAAKLDLSVRSPWPAIAIIAIGSVLLAANLFHFQLLSVLWPGFIIVPGLMLLWPAYSLRAGQNTVVSVLAVPGAIITGVGFMLFVMNLTHHFEAWAYSWTLLPVAAMAGLMYAKRFDMTSRVHEFGRRLFRIMVILFISLAVLFEIIIFENLTPWLSLTLIIYGIYLLVKGRRETV